MRQAVYWHAPHPTGTYQFSNSKITAGNIRSSLHTVLASTPCPGRPLFLREQYLAALRPTLLSGDLSREEVITLSKYGTGSMYLQYAPSSPSHSEAYWQISPEMKSYNATLTLTGHTDWVRDVAWAPTILQRSYIASASQDKTVRIWTSDPAHPDEWQSLVLNFDAVVWRVSWSLSGNVLAVSGGDNKVSLWKENLKGEWECVKTIEE